MDQPGGASNAPVDSATASDEVQESRAQPPAASEIRVDKVLEIRRQLGEGTYSIADRLDVVIERIIVDLS
jgi:anti-sigma28 factor (negative regulator of flagellin synthesis)